MLKRYKNYIISSDNEEENDDENIIVPPTQQIKKEESNILKNKNNEKNLNKLEDNKRFNKLNDNSFNNDKEEEKIKIKKVIYCEPCDKRLESNQDYLLHMSSKRHKYKMRELLRKELKELGSEKKVLIKEKMIAPCRRWRINHSRYLLYGFSLNRYLNK